MRARSRDDLSSRPSSHNFDSIAGIAQLVEHNLAKVGVAGSSPVSRLRVEQSYRSMSGARVCAEDAPSRGECLSKRRSRVSHSAQQ